MKRISLATLLILSLFCFTHVYAETKPVSSVTSPSRCPHLILGIGGGAAFTRDAGQSQTFPIVDPITDEAFTYNVDHHNQSVGLFNLFFGGEWPLGSILEAYNIQTGLSYYYLGTLSARGILVQGADPASSNAFPYHYHIQSQQLLLETKLLYACGYFHPYISLGLGAAWNRADNFGVEMPSFITFTREYARRNTRSFTYNFGVGFDYDVTKCIRLGIGYRHSDLGKVWLGRAHIDTTLVPGTISQSHLYVDEVLAQATFLLPGW